MNVGLPLTDNADADVGVVPGVGPVSRRGIQHVIRQFSWDLSGVRELLHHLLNNITCILQDVWHEVKVGVGLRPRELDTRRDTTNMVPEGRERMSSLGCGIAEMPNNKGAAGYSLVTCTHLPWVIIGAAGYSLVTCNRLPWVIIGAAGCSLVTCNRLPWVIIGAGDYSLVTCNHLPWVIIGAAGCSLVTCNRLPWVIIGAGDYSLVTCNHLPWVIKGVAGYSLVTCNLLHG